MVFGTLSHTAMVGFFYFYMDWGFTGICWATGLMFFVRCSINVLSVICGDKIKKHPDVHFFSKETISWVGLGPQLKIMTQSLVMSVWGWWAFDIFTLMASYLSAEVTGAQTIMRSLGLISFMMPVGFATASFAFVGISVGKK